MQGVFDPGGTATGIGNGVWPVHGLQHGAAADAVGRDTTDDRMGWNLNSI